MTRQPKETNMTQLAQRLTRRARRLGAQPCDAEDMAQDALLRLIQRSQRADVDAPERYAMIILHNIARALAQPH
jgi:DNA-directed RNA polymerase specialized sigma24 family protein